MRHAVKDRKVRVLAASGMEWTAKRP